MTEEKTKKIRKKANVTTITEFGRNSQRITTIPKVYCDAKNWNNKDQLEWVDTGAGILVRKVNK